MKNLRESLLDDIDVQVNTAQKNTEIYHILTSLCTCKSDSDFRKYVNALPRYFLEHGTYDIISHKPLKPKDGFYIRKIKPAYLDDPDAEDIEIMYAKDKLMSHGATIYVHRLYKDGHSKELKWGRGYTHRPSENPIVRYLYPSPSESLYYCGDDPMYESLWEECIKLVQTNVIH